MGIHVHRLVNHRTPIRHVQHRVLGGAILHPVGDRELRPRVLAEQPGRPFQRIPLLRKHTLGVPPLTGRLPQKVDRRIAPATSQVPVLRRRAPGEVVDPLRTPPHPLPTRRRLAPQQTQRLRLLGAVMVAAVEWLHGPRDPGRLPARIAGRRDAGGAQHLVPRQLQRHVVARERPVELPGPQVRARFPPVGTVERDPRVPVGPVVMATPPPLPPGLRRQPRLPVEDRHQRLAGPQRFFEHNVHNRRVGAARVARGRRDTVHAHARDPLEGVHRRAQVLERAPAGPEVAAGPGAVRAERVQVLVEDEPVEGLGRVVGVPDPGPAGEYVAVGVLARLDPVLHVLLERVVRGPVGRGLLGGVRCGRQSQPRQDGGEGGGDRGHGRGGAPAGRGRAPAGPGATSCLPRRRPARAV